MKTNFLEVIEGHIKTHSERSVDDNNAVKTIEYFIKSNGKINSDFSSCDKWPNIDGRFELVPHPEKSRKPVQNFFVQIKGTSNLHEENGIIKYHLKNLAFPAFIHKEISNDPGILIVVFKPNKRNEERIFWKHMSPSFLENIDFNKNSVIISFSKDDELFNTDESLDNFANKLLEISENYSFLKQLGTRYYSKEEIIKCVQEYASRICDAIKMGNVLDENREQISKRLLRELKNLCESSIILNGLRFKQNMSLRSAWDIALLSIETKFLAVFLQGLKYIDLKIPEEGQNERIMLKYYDFLWKIRQFMYKHFKLDILENLEEFPIVVNSEEKDFNEKIAETIEKIEKINDGWKSSRYYIQKVIPFYVGKNRYFEVTLQLASKYATKYNRLTVYTKEDISTNYCIQMCYEEAQISIWDYLSKIKVLTKWKVSIEPSALNKFALFFNNELKISSKYNEYINFMEFLTQTGLNLLDFIDLKDELFNNYIEKIYQKCKTDYFKPILIKLHKEFDNKSSIKGKNIIRYILLHMKEEIIDNSIEEPIKRKFNENIVKFNSSCWPFERNPILYNLPKHKIHFNDMMRAVGSKTIKKNLPYLKIKNYIDNYGEVYYPLNTEQSKFLEEIKDYNCGLTSWDYEKGKNITIENGYAYIDNYVNNTVEILNTLLLFSKNSNEGQDRLNDNYVKTLTKDIDQNKKLCLKKVFVNSNVLLIYGAAGTGKTTLMNYISKLMSTRKKLFLAKTHTALENLQRRINEEKQYCSFESIDKAVYSNVKINEYDMIFIDECSTIDNRLMLQLLEKINNDILLVLAGDIYQIESIDFGNWFFYAKEIMPEKSMVELNDTWRTDDQDLKHLWDEVRNKKYLITEVLTIDGPYSKEISNDLFVKKEEDEVVLCLNYDGKYGLNSINNYFQEANEQSEFTWKEWKYRIGDPILFNESKRFPMLYNNLKGRIVNIEKGVDYLQFFIEVPLNITSIDSKRNDFQLVGWKENSTIISFYVRENGGGLTEKEREEAKINSIVPFQLAYAVSIHKAQGLEYDSVKIVIPSSNSEFISHGVFYTAITRTKEKLKIYWSADTMDKIIKSFYSEQSSSHSLILIKELLKKEYNFNVSK